MVANAGATDAVAERDIAEAMEQIERDPYDDLPRAGQAALWIAWTDALKASGFLIGIGGAMTSTGVGAMIGLGPTGYGLAGGAILAGLGVVITAGGLALGYATGQSMSALMPSRAARVKDHFGLE